MPRLAVSKGEYVSFAHKLLWDSSCRHLTIADEKPDDSWMLTLSAGLLAAAAFEAYLNYVGEEILPQVWANERTFFSSDQYRGTAGKLKRIAEEIPWALPPKSRKPFSGLVELQNLRDRMVHAKPKKASFRQVHKAGGWPRLPSVWLYQEYPPKKIRRLIADVEAFAVEMHRTIQQSDFAFVIHSAHPLLGMLGYATSTQE